jgi:DNA-binding transcriptional LysR family regulator
MELYQLKSFLTIAHEQNLTRAAEALHLSQSALSSQIKLLEEELSVQLFKRTSRGMAITDNGRILMTHAQDVLEAAGQMQQRAAALSRGISATVSIGLNTDPTFLRVSAINQRLRLLHANTNVILHICQSIDTPQKLRHGQIDLGFFYGNNQETEIEHVVISQVRICVVIPNNLKPADRELDWQGIAELPWIWVDNNFPFFKVLQHRLQDYRTLPNQAVTAVDEQIVRELVAAGHGVAIMREDEARALVKSGQVTIWSKGWGEIPLCLGWLASRRQEKNIKEAREIVNYVWQKPVPVTDGSLADKCWV